jgi:hypothetical protein
LVDALPWVGVVPALSMLYAEDTPTITKATSLANSVYHGKPYNTVFNCTY